MKRTITAQEMAKDLRNDPYANWSEEGAKTMAEYLLEFEADCGTEMEWDIAAVRADYQEYESACKACRDLGLGERGQSAEKAMELLESHTWVHEIGNSGRVIVANY